MNIATLKSQSTPKQNAYTQLTIQHEEEYGLAWYHMHAMPRPCFTPVLLDEIRASLDEMDLSAKHGDVQYLVLASDVPNVFNFGGDLSLFVQFIRNQNREGLLHYAMACVEVLYRNCNGFGKNIATLSLVQGDALGGGFEAAISSDVLIAERSAKMGFPEILFNLFPGMGAYSFLSRKIGAKQAEKMILGGCLYSAEELYNMGVVDILAEDGQGEMAVYDYIEKESKRQNGVRSFRAAQKCCNPVTYKELTDITEVWVDAALRLKERNLRMMERLVKRQSANAK